MSRVIVTTSWDDGHTDDIRLAQVLKKYGIRGTFYISPLDRLSTPEERITEEQIKELAVDFEIGAHTMTHPNLLELSESEAKKEIVDSKIYLEKVTGKEVSSFCYPSGFNSEAIGNLVREAGFTLARTVERFSTSPTVPFHMDTTVHAYRHWSDAWKIYCAVGYKKFLRCLLHWDELAIELFDRTPPNGVFHLWGHSWEISDHHDWERLERVLAHIANRNVQYADNRTALATYHELPHTVAFVSPYFLPHGGGLEQYVYNIASRLQRDYGWRVIIITSGTKGGNDVVEEYHGLTVYRLSYTVKLSNSPLALNWRKKIQRILQEEQVTLMNVHMPVPGLGDIAIRSAGKVPIVLTYHAGTMLKKKLLPDIAIWLYEHFIRPGSIRKSKEVICSSNFVLSSVFRALKHKATVITPAVDINVFHPNDSVAKEKNAILFICNSASMHRMKGLHVLCEALQRVRVHIPDVSLKVVGELGTSSLPYVRFIGPRQREEVVPEIQGSCLLVLCSLAPAESFGMVLIEAMACKVPVIGSYAGGIPEVIRHSIDGLLVPPKDAVALANSIEEILLNPAFASKLAERGYEKVKKDFVWDTRIKETADVFMKALV